MLLTMKWIGRYMYYRYTQILENAQAHDSEIRQSEERVSYGSSPNPPSIPVNPWDWQPWTNVQTVSQTVDPNGNISMTILYTYNPSPWTDVYGWVVFTHLELPWVYFVGDPINSGIYITIKSTIDSNAYMYLQDKNQMPSWWHMWWAEEYLILNDIITNAGGNWEGFINTCFPNDYGRMITTCTPDSDLVFQWNMGEVLSIRELYDITIWNTYTSPYCMLFEDANYDSRIYYHQTWYTTTNASNVFSWRKYVYLWWNYNQNRIQANLMTQMPNQFQMFSVANRILVEWNSYYGPLGTRTAWMFYRCDNQIMRMLYSQNYTIFDTSGDGSLSFMINYDNSSKMIIIQWDNPGFWWDTSYLRGDAPRNVIENPFIWMPDWYADQWQIPASWTIQVFN